MSVRRVIQFCLAMMVLCLVSVPASAQVLGTLDVAWRIDVLRRGVVQSTYEGAGFCLYTSIPAECANDTTLPPQEARFFESLCGGEELTVTVEPEDVGLKAVTCDGRGPWEIVVTVKLQDVHGNPQGESFPVNFTMLTIFDPTAIHD